jgi:HAD superfamily hydrolase (TIGR01549 family)
VRARCGVGFDIDHTLCIDNKLERVVFLHLLERVVRDGGSPLGSLAEESERIDALLAHARSGAETIEAAVERFARERGAHGVGYVEDFKRMALAMAASFVVPDPQAPGTIAELTRLDIPHAVLSNGWNPLQEAKARRAGFTGRVIASGDLGVQKPDPKAFAVLVDELGGDPERCFYIGDDPVSDVQGALGAGLRAIWLDHEGKVYPADCAPPTFTVHSLQEALAVIAAEAHAT